MEEKELGIVSEMGGAREWLVHPQIHPPAPCLMLPRTATYQVMGLLKFYCPLCEQDLCLEGVPDNPRWTACLNSSGEWLIVFDDFSDPYMFSPATGTYHPLPPLSTFENVSPLYGDYDPDGSGPITSYQFEHLYPMPIFTVQGAGKAYFRKVVVASSSSSSSSYTVMAIHQGIHRKLAFARKGDTVWTEIEAQVTVQDIMHLKGRFYVVDYTGIVTSYDFPPSGRCSASPKDSVISDTVWAPQGSKRYLAHSPDGRKIYQILKLKEHKQRFQAYELLRNKRWVPATDFYSGGCALFLGDNDAISIEVGSIPTIPGGCVYFTDVYEKPRPRFDDGGSSPLRSQHPIPGRATALPAQEFPDTAAPNLHFKNFATCYRPKFLSNWPCPIWYMGEKHSEPENTWGKRKVERAEEKGRAQKKRGKRRRQGQASESL